VVEEATGGFNKSLKVVKGRCIGLATFRTQHEMGHVLLAPHTAQGPDCNLHQDKTSRSETSSVNVGFRVSDFPLIKALESSEYQCEWMYLSSLLIYRQCHYALPFIPMSIKSHSCAERYA